MPRLILCFLVACLLPAAAQAPEYRAQWADAFNAGFLNGSQVTTMMANLRTAHANVVIPEVRVNADAYFAPTPAYYPNAGTTINANGVYLTMDLNSDPEPRKDASFDALGEVVRQAHDTSGGRQRLDVWPWIVSFRTGTVMRTAHPDWLTCKPDGTSVTSDFDPGHPGVEQQFFNACMDILDHYAVDGLHYDYIRFTASDNGYNPVSIARFNARYGRSGTPSNSDALWQQWRRDQVTAAVRKVYLNAIKRRPEARISAALITWAPGPARPSASDTNPTQTWKTNFQTQSAYTSTYQDWRGWMQEGILDISIPMAYFGRCSYQTAYERWMDFTKENQFGRQGMIGPGVYLNTPADTVYQVEGARAASSPNGATAVGQSLYSYATPYADACYGTGIKDPAGMARVLSTGKLTDGTVVTATPPYPTTAALPPLPRLTNGKGHLMGTVTDTGCAAPGWVDGATVSISGPSARTQRTDGTGFYGFVDLTPGTYLVTVSAKGLTSQTEQVSITAGQVSTQNFALSQLTVYNLVFTSQPSGAVAGQAFRTQPAVKVVDSTGNLISTYTSPVTLTLKPGTGATGAALGGTATVSAVNGVATFSGLSIDLAGAGYVLTAGASLAAPADSAAFTVDMSLSQFGTRFTRAGTAVPGSAPTSFSGIAVNRNPGSPYYGYLYCAEKLQEHKVRIYKPSPDGAGTAATAYVDTGLRIVPTSAADNNPWDVVVGPDDTVWVMNLALRTVESAPPVPPAGSTEAAAVRQIDVAALSGSGIGASGPRGIAVAGPVTAASVYLSLTGGGGGFYQKYSVAAANASTAGSASLVWSVTGSNLTYGVAVDPQGNSYWPISASAGGNTLARLDPSGASLPFTAAIPAFFTASLALGDADYVPDASRPDGGFLAVYSRSRTGTASVSNPDHTTGHRFAMDGTWLDGFGPAMPGAPATYSEIPLIAAGAGDSTGSAGSAQYFAVDDRGSFYGICKDAFPGGNSAYVKVDRLAQAVLAFATPPAGARAEQPFDTQPVIAIRDLQGQTLNVAGSVTLSIKPGTGTPGASLVGTATVTSVSGSAAFSGLAIDRAGKGYLLVASCSTLPPVESPPFDVAQVPARLAFTVQPGSSVEGRPLDPQPVVSVLTSDGSLATDYTGPITVALYPDLGTPGASLTGATTVDAVGGIAAFSGLAVDTLGTGYLLEVSGSFGTEYSAAFDVERAAYTTQDVLRALRIASGQDAATPRDLARFDLNGADGVDLRDAAALARKAAGLDPNP